MLTPDGPRDAAAAASRQAAARAHAVGGEVGVVGRTVPLLRTFIVEDSAVILDNLIGTLEETAPVHVVGSAADENAALASLIRMRDAVDLIVVDIFLKSGSGLGVLQRVAQQALRARRVVLTNYCTPELQQYCLDLGADRVFDKSGDFDELIDYCARLASQSSEGA